MLLKIICALLFLLSSFLLIACSAVISLQSYCFSVGVILVLLLAAQGHRGGIQLPHLYTVLVTEAAPSEQSKEGEI